MTWRDRISSFDLTRLTWLGWLLFFLSVGGGLGAAIALGFYLDATYGRAEKPRKIVGVVGFFGAIGLFILAKVVLEFLGIRVMQPALDWSAMTADEELAERQRRVLTAKRWRLFFLLLMPLGFVISFGMAAALAAVAGPNSSSGITLPQVFAMIGVGSPIIGLAGWLIARGEVSQRIEALAKAEQARERQDDIEIVT